jgi:hypothetical protein
LLRAVAFVTSQSGEPVERSSVFLASPNEFRAALSGLVDLPRRQGLATAYKLAARENAVNVKIARQNAWLAWRFERRGLRTYVTKIGASWALRFPCSAGEFIISRAPALGVVTVRISVIP